MWVVVGTSQQDGGAQLCVELLVVGPDGHQARDCLQMPHTALALEPSHPSSRTCPSVSRKEKQPW